jgi:predicted GIY-YIG superfamily endonuclease
MRLLIYRDTTTPNKMDSITIYPIVYVLRCEDDTWYVGITYNFNIRMAQHWNNEGSRWTKLHKPLYIHEVIYPAKPEDEDKKTLELIERWGRDKVRGGNYCKP